MKKALIYGINLYPLVGPGATLQGCINDANAWKALLEARGFTCTMLLDSQATAGNILAHLNGMVDGAQPGDVLVLAGASHGSYTFDSHRLEADMKDEVIATYDFPQGYIMDDTLRAIFGRLPNGVICDVFIDSCYSGTITRLMSPRHKIPVLGARYIKYEGKPRKLSWLDKLRHLFPGRNDQEREEEDMGEVLLSSSRQDQQSNECYVGAVARGIFSYYAQKAITENPSYSRQQIIDYCRPRITVIGLDQTPQIEGRAANKARPPFS